jgi:4-amino-4-deoxy-L-arabinose transferase-like glycosyltransferase
MANFRLNRPAAIGAVLALAAVPLPLYLSKTHSEEFAAVFLAAACAVYIGFGLQKGNQSQMATEILAGAGFFAAALAGLWVSAWIVPIALAAHGIWDYAHHQNSKLTFKSCKSWRFVAVPAW